MNLKKKVTILTIIISMVLASIGFVNAADKLTAMVSVSSKSVKPGDEVSVTIGLKNIAYEEGTMSFKTALEYDSEKLAFVEIISANSNWGSPFFDKDAIKNIQIDAVSAKKEDQNILTIKFKAKDGVKDGTTQVKFSEIQLASEDNEESTADIVADVNISSTGITNNDNNTVNNNTTSENKVSGNNVSNNTNTTNNTNNNSTSTENKVQNTIVLNGQQTNSSSSNTLPRTGIESYLTIAIILLVIIAVVAYLKYKKYKGI